MTQSNGEVGNFIVKGLDLGGISESDLASSGNNKPGYLTKPGSYTFKIIEHKLYVTERGKDGAGKQWGGLLVKVAEAETGRIMSDFISVPLESLIHTSRNGKETKVKTQIFVRFMQSVLGKKIATSEIANVINNLSNLLTDATLVATVGYKSDTVRFAEEAESGEPLYAIFLANGSELLDDNGQPMRFTSRDAGSTYYKQINGRNPSVGMEFITFKARAAGSAAVA